MLRRALWSIFVALTGLSLLVIGVAAQADKDDPGVLVQPSVPAATVAHVIPVTLTLTIPGPTGPVTVEVPIYLSLDIRIGISPQLTTTVEVTPSVVTIVGGRPTATATATASDESDDASSNENNEESTPVSTVAAATAEPTPTQSPPDPTATTVPDEAESDEVQLPTATPSATATSEADVLAPLCPDPRAVITSPGEGQVVSEQVNLLGTATHENFQYYKVEYAQGANIDPNSSFSYLADARVQVTGGLLASFDSTNLANGPYTLKLTVVDNSGNFPPPCTVSVVVEN